MAFDGITIAAILHELNTALSGGRIDKVYQPHRDEIILLIRCGGKNHKLLFSANTSHPRLHLTEIAKENPLSAPLFCMSLRKHIVGGKVISFQQPAFERIAVMEIESKNEMGDSLIKKIVIEIMGKHSNIILLENGGRIIDSIKHITPDKSSVRQILPGLTYQSPPNQGKCNPLFLDQSSFLECAAAKPDSQLQNFLYQSFTGISPVMAGELCCRAHQNGANYCGQTEKSQLLQLFQTFSNLMQQIKNNQFQPEIIKNEQGALLEFSAVAMSQFDTQLKLHLSSPSRLVETFYQERDQIFYLKQKSSDLRKLIITHIERCVKKRELQNKTEKEISNRNLLKRKGELITANIYQITSGSDQFICPDFYDPACAEIKIALDPALSPAQNAQTYFKQYAKAKRTHAALEVQKKQNEEELNYLEGVLYSLETAVDAADLSDIRGELAQAGYAKPNTQKKQPERLRKSKPLHYLSTDGYDIFVGKNNLQNDELTLRIAKNDDWWFHTKNIPGSHVIVKRKEETDFPPDATLLEAATLAAFFSKAKNSSLVAVDYTIRKHVKKPNGAKPGMVIYEKNKTLLVPPDQPIAATPIA